MKIKEIKVWRENLVLTRPYAIAFKTVTSVENCFVEIITENGMTGMGSGNPSKQVVGESIEDTMAALQMENINWLIGREVSELQQLCFEINQKMKKTPAARAALDIALHDVFTKSLGVPLVKYFGQKIKSLPTSITIGIKNIAESIEEAEEYYGRGFKILKVKLGKNIDEDIALLTKLREAMGNNMLIRIDANQGYDTKMLKIFFDKTRKLDIELIEQPLPATAVTEMKNLPDEIKEKIAADESLLSPKDAFQLVSAPPACGIFNIKLMKCGGVSKAKEIATIAENSGTELMWGCNDESIVSITAALHAALSSPATKYIDLDGSLDLAKDIVEGGFVLKDGMMSVTDRVGLGVSRM